MKREEIVLLNSIQTTCSGLRIERQITRMEEGAVSWQQNIIDLTGSTREPHLFRMVNHTPTRSSELQADKRYHSISDFLESIEAFFTSSSQRIIGFSGWFWKTKTYFPSPHGYKGNWKHQIWKHQSSLNVRFRIQRAKKRRLWHLLIFIAYFLKRKCMWSEGVYSGERGGHTRQK